MIPTMMVFGVALGRWWKTALVASAVVWPLVVFWGGSVPSLGTILSTALLGLLNGAVGVGIHQSVLAVIRRLRQRASMSATGAGATTEAP